MACYKKSTLAKFGEELKKNCRGQKYDVASNMSARHGMEGIMSRENGNALLYSLQISLLYSFGFSFSF